VKINPQSFLGRVAFAAFLIAICTVALGGLSAVQSSPLAQEGTRGFHIVTTSVDDAVAGAPYVSTAFEATGGKFPYTWDATGLPDGLSFGSSDVIHGRATKAGTFPIVVTVTDNTKPTPQSSTGTFKITVRPGPDTHK
jgi:hypothetical protein